MSYTAGSAQISPLQLFHRGRQRWALRICTFPTGVLLALFGDFWPDTDTDPDKDGAVTAHPGDETKSVFHFSPPSSSLIAWATYHQQIGVGITSLLFCWRSSCSSCWATTQLELLKSKTNAEIILFIFVVVLTLLWLVTMVAMAHGDKRTGSYNKNFNFLSAPWSIFSIFEHLVLCFPAVLLLVHPVPLHPNPQYLLSNHSVPGSFRGKDTPCISREWVKTELKDN